MSFLFGGGNASKDAAKSRAMQQVANERQLSATQMEEQRAKPSRKAPRGRRLFETMAGGDLASTLAG